nr:hypothetical protein [Tanacetum cinerariifolium]
MVAYLQKPEGSEGFHQIVDFLNTCHISTLDNGDMEITATNDGKVKVVTEASVKRHLKLGDSDDKAASTGVDVRHGGAATTVISLDARQDSDRVVALETDLKQIKKVYGVSYTKLIMKVKKLEKTFKTSQSRRRAKIVVSDDEKDLEDPSKQERKIDEIDQDPNISLIQHDAEIQGREVSTAEPVSTTGATVTTASVDVSHASPTRRVFTADDITIAEILVYIRRSVTKDKEWENIRARVKVDEELTQRLQAKEMNKYSEVDQEKMLVDLINQRKRYFAAQKAKAKRNKPMTQAQQRTYMRVNTFVPMETKDRGRASKLAAGSSQATITDSAEARSSKRATEAKLDYEGSKRDDLVMLWSLVKERFSSIEPTDDKERTSWVELKRLFEPDTDDTLWKLQRERISIIKRDSDFDAG